MENFHEVEAQRYWSFPASFKGDKATEVKNMIFSGEYVGSRKMDGAFYKFCKDENGNMELLGRSKGVSGDYLDKIGHVPHLQEFFNKIPNGSCLIGEIVFPKNEGSNKVTTIMGCIQAKGIARQVAGEKLHYYVFDVLGWNGETLLKNGIEKRTEILNLLPKEEHVDIAEYFEGIELWNKLQEILADGGEGIVITRKNTPYQPGKRTARQTLKIKKELQETVDVVILDSIPPKRDYKGKNILQWNYWENSQSGELLEGNYYEDYSNGLPVEPVTKNYFKGWAGSLVVGVCKEDKLIPIGALGGMTDEVLSNWEKYKGCVAEIGGMEIFSDTLSIRHPRFLKWRPDKRPSECSLTQLQ